MSREIPPLPGAILELAPDILSELTNFRHIHQLHGKRTTYTSGCHGPLCRRADRLFNRERYAKARVESGKPYNPSDMRRDERDDELDVALRLYYEHCNMIEIHVRLAELYRALESTA